MKIKWQLELPQWLLLAAMFFLAAWTWPTAPDSIPVHWNVAGNVDRYGGKFEGLMALPLMTLGIYLLLLVIPRIDPGRANYPRFRGAYATVRLSLVVVMALLYGVVHLTLRGSHVDVGTIVPAIIGGLFIVLGNVMGKLRPNWFVGIRTPWTLSSKTAWVKTHHIGGWLFIFDGLAIMSLGVLRPSWAIGALIACIAGTTLWSFVYSYLVWRGDRDKVPPAGTLPADEESVT